MGLVSFSNINTDDAATANVFNSRFGAIKDELNGNIDADNLSTSAITTGKIADNAVTNAKLQTLQQYRGYRATNDIVYTGGAWADFPTMDTTDYNDGFTPSGGAYVPNSPGTFQVYAVFQVNDISGVTPFSMLLVAAVKNIATNAYTTKAVMAERYQNMISGATISLNGTLKVNAGEKIQFRLYTTINIRHGGAAQASSDDSGRITQVVITEVR